MDSFIEELKNLQEKHRLFLDLDEDEVRMKYCETYPKGTHYANFLCMISGMSKEDKKILSIMYLLNKCVQQYVNLGNLLNSYFI